MAPASSGQLVYAFLSVCEQGVAFILSAIEIRKTVLSKQWTTQETYSFPSFAGVSVISVAHFVKGSSAKKSRLIKSSDFRACLSALVFFLVDVSASL